MSAVGHLETLQHVVKAARGTVRKNPGAYVNGMNDGFDIALKAIERELNYARALEQLRAPEGEPV